MAVDDADPRQLFSRLRAGDRVEVTHEIKIGLKRWNTTSSGTVVRLERRRHGLHFQRNNDDRVFSDVLVLTSDDGSLTTVTMDEFTTLRRLEPAGG